MWEKVQGDRRGKWDELPSFPSVPASLITLAREFIPAGVRSQRFVKNSRKFRLSALQDSSLGMNLRRFRRKGKWDELPSFLGVPASLITLACGFIPAGVRSRRFVKNSREFRLSVSWDSSLGMNSRRFHRFECVLHGKEAAGIKLEAWVGHEGFEDLKELVERKYTTWEAETGGKLTGEAPTVVLGGEPSKNTLKNGRNESEGQNDVVLVGDVALLLALAGELHNAPLSSSLITKSIITPPDLHFYP
ncbi:hypothetical protein Q3G72_031796 [Acer saccharum]|nr:hypothetical protein Q3G72_031796 [Acer saccharum]